MARPDEARALEVLELAPGASMEDIHRAYHLLRRLHNGSGGMSSAPAMDEFASAARLAVLEAVEAAYALLCARREPEAPARPPQAPAASRSLRSAREAAGLSLDQVAAETHVRPEYLAALEDEQFHRLRLAAVNVRGYLTAYANAVGLPAEAVVPAYMEKFTQWQARQGI